MTKRKPRARDRDIAEAIISLPVGRYRIVVEQHSAAPVLKPEGSRIIFHEFKRFRIEKQY